MLGYLYKEEELMMSLKYETRYAVGHNEVNNLNSEQLRAAFLAEDLFQVNELKLIYTHYDRFIIGSAVPKDNPISLNSIDPLKAQNFLDRRELGIINIGDEGVVIVDGIEYQLKNKEALYVGANNKSVVFSSVSSEAPAKFYLNSAPAHKQFPIKKVSLCWV